MATDRGKAEWERKKKMIAAGLCRTCGKPRGKKGTKEHCRIHADAHTAYLVSRKDKADEPQATTV